MLLCNLAELLCFGAKLMLNLYSASPTLSNSPSAYSLAFSFFLGFFSSFSFAHAFILRMLLNCSSRFIDNGILILTDVFPIETEEFSLSSQKIFTRYAVPLASSESVLIFHQTPVLSELLWIKRRLYNC